MNTAIQNIIDNFKIQEVKHPSLLNFLKENKTNLRLVFVCTHNSRRSQFAQVWAHVLAHHFGIKLEIYSAGTEVTACNPRTLEALQAQGFSVDILKGENPVQRLSFAEDQTPIQLFSKTIDDASLPKENFAALMTCSHADENCPYIPGALARIPFRFEDPKAFDDTDLEAKMYQERSLEIAQDIYTLFYHLKND